MSATVEATVREPGVIIGVMLGYLAVCTGLGIHAWRRTSSLSDFILGGRSLGKLVTAFSTAATDMSGWLLMGFPALAYLSGFDAIWFAAGSMLFAYLNWLFIAPRIRAQTERFGDALTLPDYLEARLKDESHLLRVATAIIILVFFTLYTSSGFVAGGRLLETLFGLDYLWGLLISSVAIVGYVYIGGFLAVSWSDVLQGVMMLLALLIVAALGVGMAGGPGSLVQALEARDPSFLSPWIGEAGQPLGVIGIVSLVAFSMGYPGQPHILARFMATSSVENLDVARRVAMLWQLLALGAAIVVGLAAVVALPVKLSGADAEKVFIIMAIDYLPAWAAGVCLAGLAAAVMSTAAAQLLVASSAATEDLYRLLVNPRATQRQLLRYGRLAVLVVTGLGVVVAMKPGETVFSLVAWAWAGFGATFGPAVVMCLFWAGTSRNGVFAGMLVGAVTVLAWRLGDGGIFGLYELVPAAIASFASIVLVSAVDHRRQQRLAS
jgi:sodium/proline symporter